MTMPVSLNIVVLGGTIATDPVERRQPDGSSATELRLDVPDIETRRRLLPLPVLVPTEVQVDGLVLAKGRVLWVHGTVERRFERSGAGARSWTGVRATNVKVAPGEQD